MNKFFKCPPRDACSANPSPLGAGGPPPPASIWGRRGSSGSASARFGYPVPPPDDCQCAFPIGRRESKPRRPIGEECVWERERSGSECVIEGTEWETPAEGREVTSPRLSLRTVEEEWSLFFRAACWSRLQSGLWMNLLIETPDSLMDCWRAQWGESCATVARNGDWERSWCRGESYQLWRCIANCEFTDCSDHSESFL